MVDVMFPLFDEDAEPSTLADFDTGRVLDALSLGIIVLDAQLSVIYANVKAEELLAFRVHAVHGHPLRDFLPQASQLLGAAQHALATHETVDCNLCLAAAASAGSMQLGVRIATLPSQMTGAHLLLELSVQQDGQVLKPAD
jgi:nitrogen-specific signal transduction histidine kinase